MPGVDVDVTPLPGIGVRQDFMTRAGRRIGVINYRDGRAELLIYRADDPDATGSSIPLTSAEAGTLASLLGAPHLVGHIADQHGDVPGIDTHQLMVMPGAPYDGHTLGESALRTRTGVSVVAVVRGAVVHPSPRPDFVFAGSDVLIVVGTGAGLAAAARVLEHG